MSMSGWKKVGLMVLSGSVLLQAQGCSSTLEPIITNLVSSLLLNLVLGGLGAGV